MSRSGILNALVPKPKVMEEGPGAIGRFRLVGAERFHRALHPPATRCVGDVADVAPGDASLRTPSAEGALVRIDVCLWPELAEEVREHLSPEGCEEPSHSPEAYALHLSPEGGVLTAGTDHGLQHGLATLRQICLLADDAGCDLPEVTILDWPDATVRGAHVCYHLAQDWMPLCVPDFPTLIESLERFAQLKLNTVLLELEAMFPFRRHREITAPGAFSEEEIRELVRTCESLRLEIIPLVQCLGHQYAALHRERYAHLRETPDRIQQLCPTNPDSAAFVLELVDEYLEQMPGIRRFHLGGDESRQLGYCARCAEKAAQEGISALYTDHVAAVCEGVKARGLTPTIWSDMLEHHPEEMERIPKDVEIAYWNYHMPDWSREYGLPRFREAGYECVAYHGVRFDSDFSNVAVGYTRAMPGIGDLTGAAIRDGARGLIVTNWMKAIPYDLSWRGYAFAAAKSWDVDQSQAVFDEAFGRVWHGLPEEAAGKIARVHDLLSQGVPYVEDQGRHLRHRLDRFDLTGFSLRERIERYTTEEHRERALADMRQGRERAGEAAMLLREMTPLVRRNCREAKLLDLAARTVDHRVRMGEAFDRLTQWTKGKLSAETALRMEWRDELEALRDEWACLREETRRTLAETVPPEMALAAAELKFEQDAYEEIVGFRRMLMEAEADEQVARLAPFWKASYSDELRMPVLRMMQSEVARCTPFQRGYAHGKAYADEFSEGVKTFLAGRTFTPGQWEKHTRSRRYVRERCPFLWEEVEGLAHALGLPAEDVFLLSAFNAIPECTAVGLSDSEGNAVIASTQDIDDSQRRFYTVERSQNEDGRSVVGIRWAGTLWLAPGMNSDGLAVATTSAPRVPGQDGYGIPQHMAPYAVLRKCATVPEAVGYLSDLVFTGKGLNMLLADRDGRMAAVEKSGDRQAVQMIRRGCIYRTNHFTAPEMKHLNPVGTTTAVNSRARWLALSEALDGGPVDDPVATAKSLLSTHGWGGLCQHKRPGLDTLAAAVMHPREGWVDLCGGKPCTDPFVRFDV